VEEVGSRRRRGRLDDLLNLKARGFSKNGWEG